MTLKLIILTGIDTEAPLVGDPPVTDIVYDEHFSALAVFYNITDRVSGLKEFYIGLGDNKFNVALRPYEELILTERNIEYMIAGIYEVIIQEGIPAWVRMMACDRGKRQANFMFQFRSYMNNSERILNISWVQRTLDREVLNQAKALSVLHSILFF